MHRIVRLAPVLLLSFFVGCTDSMAPISLTLNRARWEKQNLHDYSYTGRRSCFCADAGKDVNVLVLADTVFSAKVIGTNVELQKGLWQTVDELFDFAERAFGPKDQTVAVDYDPTLGYPARIKIGCSPGIADCGETIEVKNLGPLAFIN